MTGKWLDMGTCPVPEDGKTRYVLVWHVYQKCMVYDSRKARKNRFVVRWMEIPENWIPVSDRRPVFRDANSLGVVIAKDIHGDVRLRGWRHARSDEGITHWMPTPEAPADQRELRDQAEKA